MCKGMNRFLEALQTDVTLQEKIKTATEAYTGEYTMEGMFKNIVEPIARAAGFDVSWQDMESFMQGDDSSQSVGFDELELVTGSCDGRADLGFDSDEEDDDGPDQALCVGLG